ncbi:pantothenate kinase [Pseudoramibacter alactolyticus ATCC 23263]|jgi:type III pantothenate kinase|uniref:Type III pantothenate kinase n=1 Tax=Pseudoramibacter alactolyticus ATCC 23263 TaxID=887929 RepID=E6MGL4_9FIRM|nr:type III pantothenate kinase [Pseudoramibacter alactolyticus]EFV01754.1 pantothenate kinase [Pseudoramibacter alactolyticus ATCC 23263]MBM6967411.1 type III pantothenate kinase [Pseudoramibacter alactolyticus]
MILVVDVGNTNTEVGAFEGDELICSWRLMTKTPRTSDEFAVAFRGFFQTDDLNVQDVTAIVVASVVPNIMHSMTNGIKKVFQMTPMTVGPGIKTGMPILTSDPTEVGADRIVDAVAAYQLYGGPVLVLDFGTATTYDYVNRDGALCAGVMTPGIQISADALFRNAAQLPSIAIQKPRSILAKDTVTNMQAGLVYGYIGQVSHIIGQMREETGEPDMKVVATGGYGRMFLQEVDGIDIFDPKLTLKGLKIIHDKNADARRKHRLG